jgi:hypothetical protein
MSDDPKNTSTAPSIEPGKITISGATTLADWRAATGPFGNAVYVGDVTCNQFSVGGATVVMTADSGNWRDGPNTTIIQGGAITSNAIYNPGMRVGINLPLYLVSYSTESGDRGIVGLFNQMPTPEHLEAITEARYPDEIEDGVSYIEYTVKRIDQVESLPPIA